MSGQNDTMECEKSSKSSKSYSFDPNLWIIDKHTPIAFKIPGNSVLTSLESDSPPKDNEQQNEGKTCED